MSDNSNDHLPGRVLNDRRVLPQSDLWQDLPVATKDYLKNCASKLPDSAVHLITHELLERGFQLKCSQCSSTDWYRAEEVGQRFRCHRCYKEQLIETNEPWLYKLPEVIFQLFSNNGDVPLLALSHLQKRSRQNFDYGLDSEALIDTVTKRNIDFSCLSDGRLYIGEAKSNRDIEKEQFEFYEDLGNKVVVDGIVFATPENGWKPGTLTRIEALRSKFKGEVLILTKSELFEE
jgi:hypothetical protein